MELTLPIFVFWLKKAISALVLPPLLPFILIFLGLVFISKRWRGGFAMAWLGLVVGLLLVTPAVVDGMLAPLEPNAAFQPGQSTDAQAIVVLGGGRNINTPEYGGDTVSRLTLERLRYGARLARATGLPILVTGGAPSGKRTPEGQLMKATLEEDFQTPVRWVEEASLDTRQNARYSAAILKPDGVSRVLLVTHAVHMKRARKEFEAQGLVVTEAPTAWLNSAHDADPLPRLPSAGSAYNGWYALHEWLGLIAYGLSR
ncbi:MAG: YdcF family protein [Azoarcus sp.]|jgi:uncharacterized SAM-binding protein YcdF (DUF218 family)|nr:YdcF family protein [Azoarcus sp.]